MKFDALRAGVDVHAAAAEKADQRLATVAGKICRKIRWRGDSGDNRDPRGQRLLHDFKRAAPRDEQDVSIDGKEPVEKAMADDFIDSIVPPNIFAEDNHLA